MIWAHNENSKKQIAMENCRMGTRGNKKEGKTQRRMDGGRWHMTHHGLTKENYRDKDIWRNLVLDARKLQYSEQIFGQMNVHSKYLISGH